MNSITAFLKSPLLFTAGAGFTWFSVKYLPAAMLLLYLVVAVAFDLFTGLLKSWTKGIATSSIGLRKTVIKIGSYVGTIVMVTILVNLVGLVDSTNNFNLTILLDALMGFMVFVELYSICENISEAYPNSPLSKYMIGPILKFLKGKIKNNPITALGQNKSKDDNPTDKGESK